MCHPKHTITCRMIMCLVYNIWLSNTLALYKFILFINLRKFTEDSRGKIKEGKVEGKTEETKEKHLNR